jgi:SH3 domain protein
MIRSVFSVFSVVLFAVAFSWGMARAESVRGRVRGVPAVNLREGPNTQSRAVAWLSEGEQVEIERVVDGWALVRTGRAETGYVRVTYLAAPEAALSRLQTGENQMQPTEGVPAATPQPEPASQASEVLEAEMTALRAQLDELRQEDIVTPGTVTPGHPEEPALQEIRRDLRTLLEQTTSIERRLASNSSHSDLAAPVRESPALPWAVLGFGVFIGLLLGAAMGRRQERKRRTRIRI